MPFPKRTFRIVVGCWLGWAVLGWDRPAWGLIDPERPASWLIGECKAIAALKVSAVGKRSATLAVTKVLRGQPGTRLLTIRWTSTQAPPLRKPMVGQAAVLLVPKDDEDPTLIQVSPEFLSLKPDPNRAGEYEFLRLNGFVKGSFNGEAADLIHLIEDTLNRRAYFPIWADTSFAPARRIGDLPGRASALGIGDLDGDQRLDIVAATGRALVAYASDGEGKLSPHRLKTPGGAAALHLADADGDGKLDILTEAGLFLNRGGRQFAPAAGMVGTKWSAARFCYIPGRPTPAIAALEGGRARLFVGGKGGRWSDVSGEMGLDRGPGGLVAINPCALSGRLAVALLTNERLISLEAAPGKPLKQVQFLPLVDRGTPGVEHLHAAQRDIDGDGIPEVLVAYDGGIRLFCRRSNGTLAEIPDHLGDVRKMLQGVEGCAGLICEDFNNDGLVEVLVWSKSQKISLVMNRGYHNLREGTAIFDLPAALKGLDEVQAVAAADIDADGDLDLIVASGKGLYLLANTFEKKPAEANERPRNPLLTVLAPGRFGALVTIEDERARPLASRRIGFGAVAGMVHFGYRTPVPPAVTLETFNGKVYRRKVAPDCAGKPILFK